MRVTVTLHGHLRHLTPSREAVQALDLPPRSTIAEILQRLGLPSQEVFAVMLGQQRLDQKHALEAEAQLEIIPAICGG